MEYTKTLFANISLSEHEFRKKLQEFKNYCDNNNVAPGADHGQFQKEKLHETSIELKMAKRLLGMNAETFIGIVTDELKGAGYTKEELATMAA